MYGFEVGDKVVVKVDCCFFYYKKGDVGVIESLDYEQSSAIIDFGDCTPQYLHVSDFELYEE